jgi:hypothetical protein
MLSFVCLLAGLTTTSWAAACDPQEPRHAPSQEQGAWRQDEGGKIAWFEGSWNELILAANESRQLVFLELWSRHCPYCKKLGQVTLRDKAVVAELKDVLCFEADMHARENIELVRRFRPRPPTLVFLDPSGELREISYGKYLTPEEFVTELRRIKRDEGTFSGLKKRIRKDPKDFEARYDLAFKLQSIGNLRGYQEQIDAIRELDPEGKSLPSRFLRFYELRKTAQSSLDLGELYRFLETESNSRILFLGWLTAWELEQYLTKVADDAEGREQHLCLSFEAAHGLWPHVPRDRWMSEGNNIAWTFYQNRERLTADDMEWALGVARKVFEVAPREAYAIDTLACLLNAVGLKEEALDAVKRCIQLEPFNPKWKERLIEFER